MEKNREELYDLKELRAIADGDDLFFHEMITLFISQIESAMPEIRNHVEKRDYAKVKAILHKIKPSVAVMGIITVKEIIDEIEHMDLSVIENEVFSILILRIEKTIELVNTRLRIL